MLRDVLVRVANAARWIVALLVLVLAVVQAAILGLVGLNDQYGRCRVEYPPNFFFDPFMHYPLFYRCVVSSSLLWWQIPVALVIGAIGLALALVVAFWRRPRPRIRQFRRVPPQWQ